MFVINFLFSIFVSIFYDKNNKSIVSVILIFFLVLFAGTRTENVGKDYGVHEDFFVEGVRNFYNFQFLSTGEISTYIIPIIVSFFTQDYVVVSIFIFALIGVSLKIIALKRYNYFFYGLLLYTSNLYLMQEMTTIRAGISSGIFLLAINDILEKNDRKFLYKMLLALCFHYSSLILITIWLILRKDFKIKYYFIGFLISIIVAVSKINLLKLFRLDLFFPKVEIYLRVAEIESAGELNVFNFRILIALFIAIFFIINLEKVKDSKLFNLLIRIHLLSIIIFFLFSQTNMVFSTRLFEMISVIQIVLYPMIIYVFNKNINIIGKIIIIIISLIQFYYLTEVSEIFTEYESLLF